MSDPYAAAERDAGEPIADDGGSETMETVDDPQTPRGDPRYEQIGDEQRGDDRDFADMTEVPKCERDVLRMEVTVDVSDMDKGDREAIARLAELYENAFQEVVAKNRDYSWSFLRTGKKLAQTPAIPFDDAARAQAFGLLTRMGDKHERLTENVYGNGDASVSDEPSVTAAEMANYAMFLAFVLENPDLATEL